MKPGLHPGVKVEIEVTVTDGMCPAFDGKVVHDVMSTVSMIYFMEKAGRKLILPYLEEEEEGAGYAIDIKHMGPAVIGQTVRFSAICTGVTPKRVVCDVIAETDENLVGKGSFTQAIFQRQDMLRRIDELKKKTSIQAN